MGHRKDAGVDQRLDRPVDVRRSSMSATRQTAAPLRARTLVCQSARIASRPATNRLPLTTAVNAASVSRSKICALRANPAVAACAFAKPATYGATTAPRVTTTLRIRAPSAFFSAASQPIATFRQWLIGVLRRVRHDVEDTTNVAQRHAGVEEIANRVRRPCARSRWTSDALPPSLITVVRAVPDRLVRHRATRWASTRHRVVLQLHLLGAHRAVEEHQRIRSAVARVPLEGVLREAAADLDAERVRRGCPVDTVDLPRVARNGVEAVELVAVRVERHLTGEVVERRCQVDPLVLLQQGPPVLVGSERL